MQSRKISIQLNGKATEVDQGSSIADLLKVLDIQPENARGIAVAVGDEVVTKEEWVTRNVTEGEEIEVITATQGG